MRSQRNMPKAHTSSALQYVPVVRNSGDTHCKSKINEVQIDTFIKPKKILMKLFKNGFIFEGIILSPNSNLIEYISILPTI